MSVLAPATELVPRPAAGRRFSARWPVRLADVDPRGNLRLDALARHLQDVASDDAADCGLDERFGWVVRRTLVEVRRPATLNEHLELTTFCSGTGRCWAERRTSIVGEAGGAIEAVSLWVQIDTATGRPATLDERFHRGYAEAAAGRRVSTRLGLPGPPESGARRPWAVRFVDLDVFDHVNNANHWPILEEVIAGADRVGVAEMEYLVPVDADTACVLHTEQLATGSSAWLVAGGTVHSAARWTPAAAAAGWPTTAEASGR